MPKPEASPFAKARLVTLQPRASILLRDYALVFLRHCDALQGNGDDIARRQAYEAMSKNLNMSIGKVKMCLPQFRKVFYQCMLDMVWRDGGELQGAPYWARLVELKLNVLPRALEEVELFRNSRSKKARKLSPSGALRLMVAYCTRHRALCSSALYAELRVALRCGAAATQLHHVWVSAQRVCLRQLAALCRAGDAPARDPAAPLPRMSRTAWRVVDLVLTYTDVDTHTVLTDESVTLYDELQALTTLFTLVQKHRVEGAGAGAGVWAGAGGEQLARAWAALHREYTAGGAVTSAVVLQRRWHELKLQARARLARYWHAPPRAPPAAPPPPPALLHLDVVRKYPHVVLGPAPCWRRLVAAGQVYQEPRDDDEPEHEHAGDDDVDAPAPTPPPPPPADDDDVLLIEKQVETIDVDSASDTENQLVIDYPTNEGVPTQNQKHRVTDAAPMDETRTAGGAPDDGTSTARTVGRLVNVASVESINNRYQESMNEQSSEAIKDSAAPSTSAGEHMDTGQTLAILQTLDPSKVRAEIIFESDSDDEPMSNITQNSLNETQIVISDVTSRANDTSDVARHDHAYSYTGNITINDSPSELQKLLQDKNKTIKVKDEDSETAHANTETNITYDKTGEITTETDSRNSVVTPILSSDASVIVRPPNSGSEDVTMQDVATTSVVNSGSDSGTGIIEFGDIAKDSYINIKVEGSDSEHRIQINDNSNNQNTLEVSEARGTENIGEDYGREVEQNYVDPKLIMETRVDLIRVHDTATWRQHSENNKYIDINRVNVAHFQPVTKNNENVFIEIEINGISKAENEASTDTVDIDMEQLVPQRSLAIEETNLTVISSDEEQIDNDELSDRDSHTSDTLSADDASAACDERDDSTSSSSEDSSDEYVPMEELIETKRKARGPKSMASGVFEWSANYDKVFSGEGSRKKRGSRRSERVAKRVQLPDIEEVRRVNSNILTAQVAPITAGASIIASENSSSTSESVSADKPADYQLDQASADSPTYLSATADKPGDQSGSADTPADQADSGNADRQWLELQPTRRELNNVLNKLTSELRARGLVCGLPAPAYCCAARRHRSVNDARRRICARAPEIQLHVHGTGACACCCRHLLAHQQQHARLGADVTRLKRDLRRLLRVPASHTPYKQGSGSFKEASGSSKKKKTSKKKNKSKQNTVTTVTESREAPPHTDLTGLAEWERQKSLNAQYFHINTGSGRKRRSDAADTATTATTATNGDGNTRPATTEPTYTEVIEAPSEAIPNKNNEPNPDVVVINDDDDENDSQSTPQPIKVAAPDTGALRSRKRVIEPSPPSKIMKLAMCPTSKQLSLVVADLKESQPKYRKLVKLQSKPQSLLKPIRLTRVVAKVASLNNINTSASAQSVASGGASASAVTGALMRVRNSVTGEWITVPSGGTGTLMGVTNSVTGTLMSVTNSVTGTLMSVTKSVTGTLMSVTKSVSGTLISVPKGKASTLMGVASSGASTLVSVPSSSAGTLMSVPSGGAGTSMSVPRGAAGTLMSVQSGGAGTLMSVPSGGAGTLMSVPSGGAGTLMCMPSGGACVSAVAGTLMKVPSGGAGTFISVPSSGAGTLMSMPGGGVGTLMSVPSGGAGTLMSVPSGGVGTFMNVPSGGAGTLMSVPSGGAGTFMSVPGGGAGTFMNVPSGGAGTLMSVASGGAGTLMSVPNSMSGTLMSVPSSGAGTLMSVPGGGIGTLMNGPSGGAGTLMSVSGGGVGTLMSVPSGGAATLVSVPNSGAGTLMSVPGGGAGTLMSVPSGGAGTLMSVPSVGANTLMSMPNSVSGTLMSVPSSGAGTLMSVPSGGVGTLMNVPSGGAGTLMSASSSGTGTLVSVSSGGAATLTSASNAVAGTLKRVPKGGAGKLVSAVKYKAIAPRSTPSAVAGSAPSAVTVSVPSTVAVSVPSTVAVSAPSTVAVSVPSTGAVSAPSAVAVCAASAVEVSAPSAVAVSTASAVAVSAPSAVAVSAASAVVVSAPSAMALNAPWRVNL